MKNPLNWTDQILGIQQILRKFGAAVISELLEECNTILENSIKRRAFWRIKDRTKKHLLTSVGMIGFTHTRFEHKETGKTAYLLDQILGIQPHARISRDLECRLLEEAAQSSYRKAGYTASEQDPVSGQTVMRHVHCLKCIRQTNGQDQEKRRVKQLYVEADEDHIALQFHEKKGDIKRFKGHGDNGRIIKLVYVHEGIETEGKRRSLKHRKYFVGYYTGEENKRLWEEVKEYIEETYDTDSLETIYFQSDGGGWMKKGMELLGADFVLDEFHLKKYVKRMVRSTGEPEREAEVNEWIKEGKKKELEEWEKEKAAVLEEKEGKKLENSYGYIKRNWKGVRNRVGKKAGVLGSSTESHVSHVISARMSSRPMGWSKEGAKKLSFLRIYWKNGGKMEQLLSEERKCEEKRGEEKILSAAELIHWEKQTKKHNGKYVDAVQARLNNYRLAKLYLYPAINKICG
ncbi:ISLre2 family transposase [Enterocloster sp.]|uniref:ISLre2 family transposase n=1 Tax=Enterocloster sp. TaxID=2719315 RepID=UPI003AB67205